MTSDLVLHRSTQARLEHFAARPSHALLLTGPDGVGKTAVAEMLVSNILGVKLEAHPYYSALKPEGASISVEAVRGLKDFMRLKTIGDKAFRRAVVIEHAETLTTEAQNAFLKLLEEPPADTLIVLTASSQHELLPTIISRAQVIPINPPGEDQLQAILEGSNKSGDELKQAYFLSGGLPGLLHALLNDEQEHPLYASVAQAKEVLQKQPFERLAMVDSLSKQKESAKNLIDALERIARAGLAGASQKQDVAKIKQWHRLRKVSLKASEALSRSANVKLVLDDLFLGIS